MNFSTGEESWLTVASIEPGDSSFHPQLALFEGFQDCFSRSTPRNHGPLDRSRAPVFPADKPAVILLWNGPRKVKRTRRLRLVPAR